MRSLSSEEQVTDDNGEELSVLEVQTTIEGMVFDGAALPAQKTKDGYQVYVSLGVDALFLRAPGMKAFLWQMGELDPASAYRVRIDRKGTAVRGNPLSAFKATNFRYDVWDQEWIILGKQNPARYAFLKINTDLPFSVLQEHFLQEGTYTGPVESAWYAENYAGWDGKLTPPYTVLVKPGTQLKELLQPNLLGGNVDGKAALTEYQGAYWLDLAPAQQASVRKQVTQEVKSRFQKKR